MKRLRNETPFLQHGQLRWSYRGFVPALRSQDMGRPKKQPVLRIDASTRYTTAYEKHASPARIRGIHTASTLTTMLGLTFCPPLHLRSSRAVLQRCVSCLGLLHVAMFADAQREGLCFVCAAFG